MDNKIENVSNFSLSGIKILRILILKINLIKRVDNIFESLSMNSNGQFRNVDTLGSIDLSFNQIEYINFKFKKYFRRLKELLRNDNPISFFRKGCI